MASRVDDAFGRHQEKGISEFLRFAAYAAVGFLLAKRYDGRGDADDAGAPDDRRAAGPRSSEGAASGKAGGHGRLADTPSEIPPAGWWDIVKRVFNEISADHILTFSAGIAFYCLLAIFPAIAALVSLYGLVADPATIRDHLATLSFVLPSGAFQIVEDQITRIVSQGNSELGIKFAASLIISLWGANAGTKAIIEGLNVAYEEDEKRSFLRLNLISLTLTLCSFASLLGLLAVLSVGPAVLAALHLPPVASTAVAILRWPLMFVLLMVGLAVIYRFGPSRDEPQWRWVSWGAALAAFLFVAASLLFSWYLTNFADYNATYGSLGAVIGLMTWMWLAAISVLSGAELNAEMEHQTARDTTEGRPQPLGTRSAKMADTVAAPSR
jgi:membrane protein